MSFLSLCRYHMTHIPVDQIYWYCTQSVKVRHNLVGIKQFEGFAYDKHNTYIILYILYRLTYSGSIA